MATAGQGLGSLLASFTAPTGTDSPVYGQELYRLAQTDAARGQARSASAAADLAMQKAADARAERQFRQNRADHLRSLGRGDEADDLLSFEGTADQWAQARLHNNQAGYLQQAAALVPRPDQNLGDIVGGGPPLRDQRMSEGDFARYQLLSNLGGRAPIKAAAVEGNTYFDPTRITGSAQTLTPFGELLGEKAQAQADRVGVPPGYRSTPDGNLSYIPGGPADPSVVTPLATAKAAGRPAAGGIKVPSGYQLSPDGQSLVFIPGGPADPGTVTKQATAKAAAKSGTPQLTTAQRNSIGSNDGLVAQIDAAIKNLETPEGRDAVGYSYNAPNMVNDYRNPKGIPTRATLANFRSAVIHARSGAAVTLSEMKNLAPFLPNAGEPAANSIAKLKSMRAQVLSENDAIRNSVTPEALVASATPGAPMAAAPGPRPTGKTISASDATAEAVRRGKDPAAAIAAYQAHGYTVTP